jgi:transaldolase
MIQSVVERLVAANPNLEIWWDSSPLIYESWKRGMLEHAPRPAARFWKNSLPDY